MRRSRLVEINLARADRSILEARHGQVWTPEQLRREFEVLEFRRALRRRSQTERCVLGSMEFQHDRGFTSTSRLTGPEPGSPARVPIRLT